MPSASVSPATRHMSHSEAGQLRHGNGAGPSRKANTGARVKRQPPSCDACRTRKLKCSGRPVVIETEAEGTAKLPCVVSSSSRPVPGNANTKATELQGVEP